MFIKAAGCWAVCIITEENQIAFLWTCFMKKCTPSCGHAFQFSPLLYTCVEQLF